MHEHLKPILEGLLFLSGDEGITMEQLLDCLEEVSKEELEETLDTMMKAYLENTHGIELVRFGGVYKFVSKESIRCV